MRRYAAYAFPLLLLAALLLFYPLLFPSLIDYRMQIDVWFRWRLFEPGTWGMLAFALILLSPRSVQLDQFRFFKWGAALWLLMVALQQIFFHAGTVNAVINGFAAGSLIAVPYFAMLYQKELKTLLKGFALLLFLLSVAAYGRDTIVRSPGFFGLAANWNWSASLLLISAPSLLFLLRFFPRLKHYWGWGFAAIIALTSLWLYFYARNPKGTFLGLALALGVFSIILLLRYFHRRTLLYSALAGIFILVAAIRLFEAPLVEFLRGDVRFFIWENGLNIFLDSPWLGSGNELYSSMAATRLNLDYFVHPHVAELHNHPHNEIIALFANYGLFALVYLAMAAVWIYRALKNAAGRFSLDSVYWLFVIFVLLGHGMVDLPLNVWPMQSFFLLVLGVLIPLKVVKKSGGKWRRRIEIPAGILLLLLMIWTLREVSASSYYFRLAGLCKTPEERIIMLEKSGAARWTPAAFYDLASLEFRRGNVKRTIELLNRIPTETGFKNYLHNHAMLANSYMLSGQKLQALPEFELERQSYPLASLNLRYYAQALMELGFVDEATTVFKLFEESMALKGLSLEDFPILTRHPEYDSRYRLIPPNMKKNPEAILP